MGLVAEDLPFDSSWCGRSTVRDGGIQVHGSHLLNLPADVPRLLNLTDPENVVARHTMAQPGRAQIFGRNELFARPATAALADHMRVAHALCIATVDCCTGLGYFVSVARHDSSPEFCERERQLLDLLLPHLVGALDLCCSMQMTRLRQGVPCDTGVMATTDVMGFLHVAEPGFVAALQREWPRWSGLLLPPELVQTIVQHRTRYLGRHLRAEFDWSGEHVLLTLRPRQRQDGLTPRERAVAHAFSSGQSYKEVARGLHMAPATVRHHLRSVYLKLGVSDKAALVHALGVGTAAP